MERDATITVPVSKVVKERAMGILDSCGITLADAISLYLARIIEAGGIPFELKRVGCYWDDPSILHPKVTEDGVVLVPRDWLDDDDDLESDEGWEEISNAVELCPECGEEMFETTEEFEEDGLIYEDTLHCKCPRCGKVEFTMEQVVTMFDSVAQVAMPSCRLAPKQ